MQFVNPLIVSSLVIAACMMLYGCQTPADSASPSNNADRLGGVQRPAVIQSPRPTPGGEPVRTVIDARPEALVNGQAVSAGELRPILTEIAGAQALQELILDRRIEEALATADLTIQPDDVAAERKMLLDSLSGDEDTALRMLDELRDREKLGKIRFELLMRRYAGLRALVRKDAKPVPGEASTQRAEREHTMMEQLSRRLLTGITVTVYDDSLADSWARRKKKK